MPNWVQCSSLTRVDISLLVGLLLFSLYWVPTHQIGYSPGPNGVQQGDAPNSSVCRAALGNAATHEAKCEIARLLRGCQFDTGFFSYMVFQYCNFTERITPTVFMIIWLIVLLGAFATIADSFFSPALIALARTLRMSQNLAGVTLLAFGNGAPDVFSAVTAITTGDPEAPDEGLGLGFLLGSGLLVNTVTAGLIMISRPFKMSRRPFLKDSLFYLCAVGWSASVLIRRRIYYADAIGFLCFYLFYVLITWASGTLHRHQLKSNKIDVPNNPTSIPTSIHFCLTCLHTSWRTVSKHFYQIRNDLCPFIAKAQHKRTDDALHEQPHKTNVADINHKLCSPETRFTPQKTNIPNGSAVSIKHSIDMTAKKSYSMEHPIPPIIEVTSPQSTDIRDFDNYSCEDHFDSFHNYASPTSNMTLGTDFPMNYLSSDDYHRQRSSSVGSTYGTSTQRRLSTSIPGTGGHSQDRCHRSQSVNRKRASGRMSTIGSDLPYMVRWIIANRELEEKDLSTRDSDWKRSPRTISNDFEGAPSEYRTDNRADMIFSNQTSKKTSRFGSVTNLSTRVPSPTASVTSPSNNRIAKGKKITLDVIPKQPTPLSIKEDESMAVSIEDLSPEEGAGPSEPSDLIRWASKSAWHHFVYYMSPIDLEAWTELPVLTRVVQILQIPIFMVFRITIPTVLEELLDETTDVEFVVEPGDVEGQHVIETVIEQSESANTSEPVSIRSNCTVPDKPSLDIESMHGWCKILNVSQCVIIPTLWPLLLTAQGKSIGLSRIGNTRMPFFIPFTLGGLAVAVIVFFTSKWNTPPRLYHRPFFATLGFVTSIIWIYALAHELVNSLETLGIVWEISEAILGLSIMALASSIGDIMSNCLLARNGYPRIAYSACMGSPLFNLLLGAGMSYTIKISRGDEMYANLSFTLTQAVLFSCLICVLVCNVVVAVIFKFNFYRAYGIVLIVIYLAFVLIAVLIEMDYIQSPQNWGLLTGTE